MNNPRLSRALGWAKARKSDRCAICGKAQNDEKRMLAKDHSHASGLRRGFLCMNCNTGLGMFKDSPMLLLSAARYLLAFESVEEIEIVARFLG